MSPQPVASWDAFESAVAGLYRALGAARVRQNVNLAGNQIDVYVEEFTESGQLLRTAIDCKFYDGQVPKSAILPVATVMTFLRQHDIIDRGAVVAYNGFSQDSFLVAQQGRLELIDFEELEAKVENRHGKLLSLRAFLARGPVARIITHAEEKPLPDAFPDTVFVAMPFSEELENVYIDGIRKAVNSVGLQCLRADEPAPGTSITGEIIDNLRRCRAVVAEVSDGNPNVFYEIGWAHALAKPTILLMRSTSGLPGDIEHHRAIKYTSTNGLEKRLAADLRLIIDLT